MNASETRTPDVTLAVKVELPMLPNYLRVGSDMYDITTFDDGQLRAVAVRWGEALVKRAHERREPQP